MTHVLLISQLCCFALLGHLEGRGWRGRAAAERRLTLLGSLAWPASDRGAALGPEAAARCRRLTAGLREHRVRLAAARLLPHDYPRLPWLSLHDGTETAWVALAQQRFNDGKASPPPYQDYRDATRLRVESWLREGKTEADIVADLDHMRDAEIAFIGSSGAQCNPPVMLPPGVAR